MGTLESEDLALNQLLCFQGSFLKVCIAVGIVSFLILLT